MNTVALYLTFRLKNTESFPVFTNAQRKKLTFHLFTKTRNSRRLDQVQWLVCLHGQDNQEKIATITSNIMDLEY
jgi:hypothetical protein